MVTAPLSQQQLLLTFLPLFAVIVGVVLGLVANTVLEMTKASISRRHLANLIRRTLLAEIDRAIETAESALRKCNDPPPEDEEWIVPLRERYVLYEARLGDLGALESDELLKVVEAYEYLYAIPEFIFPFSRGIERAEKLVLARVPRRMTGALRQMNEQILERLRPARSALQNGLKPRRLLPGMDITGPRPAA